MAGLLTLRDIYEKKGKSFINKLFNSRVMVTENLNGSRVYAQRGTYDAMNNYTVDIFKRDDRYPITKIDRLLMQYYEKLSFLPTKFDSNWQSKDFYSCLTGDAQLSIIWLKLYQIYGQEKFLENAIKLNNYLKLNQIINSRNINVEGAIKGSDPIWGGYNPFGFPNWATKFFCDALMLEDLILSD